MCIFCGNDVPQGEVNKYQQIINTLESVIAEERAEKQRLNKKLQQVEHELILERQAIPEDECVDEPSLDDEVFRAGNFFSLVNNLVRFGFNDNPFYKYVGDDCRKVERSDKEVIEVVESQAEARISKVSLEGRLRELKFVRQRKMVDEDDNRFIQIGFEAAFDRLLPGEINVLLKAGEGAFSDRVNVDNNEIHMYKKNRWFCIFYHSMSIDCSVNIEFTFNFYADDGDHLDAGREHVTNFLNTASNTALMHGWLNFEQARLASRHNIQLIDD